jgi:hypothetical protein
MAIDKGPSRAQVRRVMARALGAHGFVATGSTFHKYRVPFVQVVVLQGSRYARGRSYVRCYLVHADEAPTSPPDVDRDGYDVALGVDDALDSGEHPALDGGAARRVAQGPR